MQQVNYSLDKMQIEQATAALDFINSVPLSMLQSNNVIQQSPQNIMNGQTLCPSQSIHFDSNHPPSISSSISLFETYASQFGLNKPFQVVQMNQSSSVNDTPHHSVEAYAALMGIKLDGEDHSMNNGEQVKISQSHSHAVNLEALLKSNGHNNNNTATSMTLPAGIGCGIASNNMNSMMKDSTANSIHMDSTLTSNNRKSILSNENHQAYSKFALSTSSLVGSQTLAPEVLQTMIQNNMQNSRHSSLSPWAIEIEDPKEKNNTETAKADKSRERNRDHSRKSRLRKKVYVEGLKQEVKQLEVYRQICEQCLDLLAILTTEASPIFTFASCAYSRVLGIDFQDLVANRRSFFDYVHVDDLSRLKNDFKRLSAFGELAGIKFRIRSIDGTYYTADTTARVTENGIVCVTRIEKFGATSANNIINNNTIV